MTGPTLFRLVGHRLRELSVSSHLRLQIRGGTPQRHEGRWEDCPACEADRQLVQALEEEAIRR